MCFVFFFNEFQGSWEKRILKSLNSMCTELSIPLAQKVMYSQLSVVKLMFFWKISLVLYACNIVFILHMVIKSCKTGIQVILAQNKFQRLWQCLLELNLRELYRQIFLCCCTNQPLEGAACWRANCYVHGFQQSIPVCRLSCITQSCIACV